MRWAILTDDYPPQVGGVSTWTEAIAECLVERGHDVQVMGRKRASPPQGRATWHGIPGPSFSRLGHHWMRVWSRGRFDVDRVLVSSWPVASGVIPRLQRHQIPYDVMFHGGDLIRAEREPARFHQVVDGARRLFVPSCHLGIHLSRMGLLGRVVPAPIDPVVSAEKRNDGAWGMIARATKLKGGERMIRIASQSNRPLEIVGDGPQLASWKRLAAELDTPVVFHGELGRAQAMARLETWSLLGLLSREDESGGAEALGLVVLEAHARGVPVVGSGCGGIPEAIGPHGLVLPNPDDVKGSSAQIASWYGTQRGQEGQRWLSERHGRHRACDVLCTR